MRVLGIAFIAVIFAAVVSQCEAADKKSTNKLQIGVKKRVKDCKVRSKKGDSLHMHYTVSFYA